MSEDATELRAAPPRDLTTLAPIVRRATYTYRWLLFGIGGVHAAMLLMVLLLTPRHQRADTLLGVNMTIGLGTLYAAVKYWRGWRRFRSLVRDGDLVHGDVVDVDAAELGVAQLHGVVAELALPAGEYLAYATMGAAEERPKPGHSIELIVHLPASKDTAIMLLPDGRAHPARLRPRTRAVPASA